MSFPAYPSYKKTGIEWLGEVPGHWNLKRLRHLLLDSAEGIKIGPFGSQLTSDMLVGFGYKVYGQENVIADDFSKGARFISNEKFREMSVYKISPGDLLVTMMGTAGRCKTVPSNIAPGIMDSHLLRMRFGQESLPDFVELLIDKSIYINHQVRLNGKGSIMHGLNSSIIKELLIALPPVNEQASILAFLDHEAARIDALIEEQQRLIELLKEKRQALISQAVTKGLDPTVPMKGSGVEWLGEIPAHWPLPKLGHLARVLNGSTPSRENMDYWIDGDIPWIASGSLNDYRIDLASEFITKKALKECSVEMIPHGSILVGLVGQGKTRGLAALLNIDATINQNVCAVVPDKEKVLSGYLHLYLHCIYEPLRDFGRGANQAALNCELVSALRIPLPCMEEQIRIVRYIENKLDEFDALEDYAQRSIGLMQERRSALISAAVTGTIDVRGWQPPASASTPELALEAV
jgi:type I restriction enzyme S subunit